jgi:hypothetical protein
MISLEAHNFGQCPEACSCTKLLFDMRTPSGMSPVRSEYLRAAVMSGLFLINAELIALIPAELPICFVL